MNLSYGINIQQNQRNSRVYKMSIIGLTASVAKKILPFGTYGMIRSGYRRIKGGATQVQADIPSWLYVNREEVDRVKHWIHLTDGKLNHLMYGMPGRDHYQVSAIMQPSLAPFRSLARRKNSSIEAAKLASGAWDRAFRLEAIESFVEVTLICGEDMQAWLEILKSKNLRGTTSSGIASEPARIGSHLDLSFLMMQPAQSLSQIISGYQLQTYFTDHLPLFIQESARVLKTSGQLLIEVPNLESERVRDDLYWAFATNHRFYSKTELLQILEKSGFVFSEVTCDSIVSSSGTQENLTLFIKARKK